MRIYYAAPLFNDMELKRNSEMKKWLESKGYEVYIGNARYTYKNANQNVQTNELLIAFKNVK